MKKHLFVAAVAVLALSISGCAATEDPEAMPSASPSATATSEPASAAAARMKGLPALEGVTRGTPTGWKEYEQAGFRFALPPEFLSSAGSTTENGTLITSYDSDRPSTASLASKIVISSWIDETGFLDETGDAHDMQDGPEWHTFAAPGAAYRVVADAQEPHTADNGDTEMFTFFTFQLAASDSRAYQLQAYLPIDDTNDMTLRKLAGSLSIG